MKILDLLQSKECPVVVFFESIDFGVARTEDAMNFRR